MLTKAADEALGLVDSAAKIFFHRIGETVRGNRKERIREHDTRPWRETGERLTVAMDKAASAIGKAAGKEPEDEAENLMSRLSRTRGSIETVLAANRPNAVYWSERGRDGGPTLRGAPVDVSRIVGEKIIGDRPGAVLTSASLSVDGDCTHVERRLGVPEGSTAVIPGQFDYAGRTVVYLPRDLPDPRNADYRSAAAERMLELIDAADGRSFILFTSWKALNETNDVLKHRCRHPLLVQGQLPRTALTNQFKRMGHAVLLGTTSFWQGIDVPGPELSCVIIDRLPFPNPQDPMTQARTERAQATSGSGFAGYQVPAAVLTLRQGAGRLMRRGDDGGVIAVLDGRITKANYAERLQGALPPGPVTESLTDVREVLDRLETERTAG